MTSDPDLYQQLFDEIVAEWRQDAEYRSYYPETPTKETN